MINFFKFKNGAASKLWNEVEEEAILTSVSTKELVFPVNVNGRVQSPNWKTKKRKMLQKNV